MDDASRALTPNGRRAVATAAAELARSESRPSIIASSPLLRARETAAIFSETLHKTPMETRDFLKNTGLLSDLIDWTDLYPDNAVLMVVGHMPDLGEHLRALLAVYSPERATFKPASVCCLTFPGPVRRGQGTLKSLTHYL